MKTILFAALIFAVMSNTALAGFMNTGYAKITNIGVTGGGGSLTVATSAPRINPFSCPFSAYLVADTDPNFDKYFALLLAAKGLGLEVQFRIDDASCAGPNPKIIFIETRDPS